MGDGGVLEKKTSLWSPPKKLPSYVSPSNSESMYSMGSKGTSGLM